MKEYTFGLTEDELINIVADMRTGNVAVLVGQDAEGVETIVKVHLVLSDENAFAPLPANQVVEDMCEDPDCEECTGN